MTLSRDKASSGGNYAPIGFGTYAARLCRVYDLGVQEREFKGEVKRSNQIYVVFELPTVFLIEDGQPNKDKPRVIGAFINLYRGAKKGKEVEFATALDPAGKYGGDWAAMVRDRLPCFLTIGKAPNSDKEVIAALSGVPMGFDIPAGKVPVVVFDLDNPDPAVFAELPEFLKKALQERVQEGAPPVQYQRTEAQAMAPQQAVSNGEKAVW